MSRSFDDKIDSWRAGILLLTRTFCQCPKDKYCPIPHHFSLAELRIYSSISFLSVAAPQRYLEDIFLPYQVSEYSFSYCERQEKNVRLIAGPISSFPLLHSSRFLRKRGRK